MTSYIYICNFWKDIQVRFNVYSFIYERSKTSYLIDSLDIIKVGGGGGGMKNR